MDNWKADLQHGVKFAHVEPRSQADSARHALIEEGIVMAAVCSVLDGVDRTTVLVQSAESVSQMLEFQDETEVSALRL